MKTKREIRRELVDLKDNDNHPQPNWADGCSVCCTIHTLRWVLDLEQDANLHNGADAALGALVFWGTEGGNR